MAFPTVQDRATSTEETAVTTHDVNLPANIASGNLIIIKFGYAVTGNTITWPNGWTAVTGGAIENAGGSTEGIATAYRQADGTEGATIQVTSSVAARSEHQSLRITGHENPSTQAPQGAGSTVNNLPPNPPSLTPTGGAKDYLWIACGSRARSAAAEDLASAPTNYSNLTVAANASVGAGFATGGTAERQLNASVEDPGAFGGTGTVGESAAITLAIHPASAAFSLVPPESGRNFEGLVLR